MTLRQRLVAPRQESTELKAHTHSALALRSSLAYRVSKSCMRNRRLKMHLYIYIYGQPIELLAMQSWGFHPPCCLGLRRQEIVFQGGNRVRILCPGDEKSIIFFVVLFNFGPNKDAYLPKWNDLTNRFREYKQHHWLQKRDTCMYVRT